MTIDKTDIKKLDLGNHTTGELLPIAHPGTILQEEFLEPLEITAYRLAKDISVPPGRITTIINGGRSITADTALRLARYFGTSAQFWLNLQSDYDLRTAERELGDRLDKEVHPRAA
ncbi:HigA family addiction module antidote protein [Marinobacterium sp. D7]|uniref:HigA family addiction module antitoxin n=1 Tax=Marinobacterium ramblicola TaxID=2849041 RepID=UPI001C2D4A63|nr:HigA family addiction module antitoxin [Marinobacterium ramblicola]MBV1787479.1 HigA family addiction module antidote protein [Marinobacterium ramblicola]